MVLPTDTQIAVFIDYENLEISCRQKFGEDFEVNWAQILETAIDLGRVVIRKAYADWSSFRSNQRELLRLGVNLVHATGKRGKNAADIKMVIDAIDMTLNGHSNISHVMLVSGDGDFTELVHHLRASGKTVIGMGVSGTSAEYLVNACDQFLYYDLIDTAQPKPQAEADEGKPATTFELSEARQLLRRVLNSMEGEWVSAGKIKSAMLRFDPTFHENNYNFSNFKEFLVGHKDLVETRTATGGHLEARGVMTSDPQTGPAQTTQKELGPEAKLDKYLSILRGQKIRMTPTEYRPTIILKFFEIHNNMPESTSLNAVKEEVHAYYEENAPNVKWQYIHETVHQMFHTRCFKFDMEDSHYPEQVRLWERAVSLSAGINKSADLLTKCDKGLLEKIKQKLGRKKQLDAEVAARLLYGSVKGQKMLDRVNQLIGEF